MVMCWSIDRLGRSLQNLVEILNELQALKIDLYFQQQGMDTSTPSGRMIFSVFGAIGEFERNLIRERVIAGQQRAKANGVKLGRPTKMNDGMRSAVKILWKMSLAGQVLWKRRVVVCAMATIGADMAAPATAAPFRRPRRRGVVRSVIVVSPGVNGKTQ
jgi:hypothetical protein